MDSPPFRTGSFLKRTRHLRSRAGGFLGKVLEGSALAPSAGRVRLSPATLLAPLPPASSSRASPNLAFPVGPPRTGLCSRAWLIRACVLYSRRGERGGIGEAVASGIVPPVTAGTFRDRAQLGSVWISQLVMGLARSQLSPSSAPLAITSSWERSLQEPLDLSSGLCLGPREGGSAYSQGSRVVERAWQCTQDVGYLHGVSTASREPLRVPGTAASLLPQSLCRVP